jgi:hypothetical protein
VIGVTALVMCAEFQYGLTTNSHAFDFYRLGQADYVFQEDVLRSTQDGSGERQYKEERSHVR